MRRPRKLLPGTDSSFDLNLAPVLDIIVSIVPMLLLSIAFIQVKTIDTDVPQVVAEAIQEDKKDNSVKIDLSVSKKEFVFQVHQNGKTHKQLSIKNQKSALDLAGLHTAAMGIKGNFPEVFSVSLKPEGDMSLEELVMVMDSLRKIKDGEKQTAFREPSGKMTETEYIFPNVTFANIVGAGQ